MRKIYKIMQEWGKQLEDAGFSPAIAPASTAAPILPVLRLVSEILLRVYRYIIVVPTGLYSPLSVSKKAIFFEFKWRPNRNRYVMVIMDRQTFNQMPVLTRERRAAKSMSLSELKKNYGTDLRTR